MKEKQLTAHALLLGAGHVKSAVAGPLQLKMSDGQTFFLNEISFIALNKQELSQLSKVFENFLINFYDGYNYLSP